MMMNPYLSWAIVVAVAGSLGWYYNSGSKSKTKAPLKPIAEKPEATQSSKKQKRKNNKKAPEPATVLKKEEKPEKPEPQLKVEEVDQPDEEIDRKELAKRFTAVKTGALAPSSTSTGKSQKKNKKNKKAAAGPTADGSSERSASRVSTRASSTTGADADDDLSPAGSPMVNATVSSAGYVSDMLETPAPAASVLRITGSYESEPAKQKAQSSKPTETKKQRQQRLKNEERKRQVQEAEQERRKLLEKQLHAAREAERREAAKTKPVATTNAWATKEVKSNGTDTPKVTQTAKVELLDTFDEPASKPNKDAPSASQASKKWDQSIPSEEEQMRILGVSSESEWTTVSNKKTKKKGGKSDESVSEASGSESLPVPSAPLPAEPKVTVQQTYIPDILRSKVKGHPLDSDWVA
ncbi:hypothetical protein MAP00_004863 [Monascus purpureus]|nr:hypothetical protein MAP00_004863 [Monascus purpureus]